MSRRYNRRSTRPIEDLPSLFGNAADSGDAPFSVTVGNTGTKNVRDDDLAMPDEFVRPRRRLRFMSFGSGSSGNCSYIGTGDCGLLIDAGVDNNFVTEKLLRSGIDISTVRGIILTHDHADHVRFAYALLRRNRQMRLYATPRTLEGLLRRHNISRRIKDYHAPIYKEHEYMFDDIRVTPFETSHDGTDNVGFAITMGDTTFVVATDMGVITERADHYLRTADAMMIESNYDSLMLASGRYPEYLKNRIRSAIGHMDNAVTAAYLRDIHSDSLKYIFLCHLSHDNNTPETALETVRTALLERAIKTTDSPVDIADGCVFLTALPRYEASDLYIL
ncbi:MAG: MBL fold metallo-hydrolase [Bacteroidales bacterium]|nr:MBL fold metallo-hydrolase [Bacteroidales bacterium]